MESMERAAWQLPENNLHAYFVAIMKVVLMKQIR